MAPFHTHPNHIHFALSSAASSSTLPQTRSPSCLEKHRVRIPVSAAALTPLTPVGGETNHPKKGSMCKPCLSALRRSAPTITPICFLTRPLLLSHNRPSPISIPPHRPSDCRGFSPSAILAVRLPRSRHSQPFWPSGCCGGLGAGSDSIRDS